MNRYRHLLPEDIRRVHGFEFAVRAMVEGHLSGRHRSRQRGASIEFQEYRQYAPGDDPGLVDWRAYARSDRHYLKTFEQETNMECHILLDSSASMGFEGGARLSKLDFASFFSACLAYLVVLRNDRVSLQTFDEKVRVHLPPSSTRQHLHQILTELGRNRAGAKTSLCATLDRAAPLIKRKGTLMILSDFWADPAALFKSLNPYLHRGFRIHLFQVLSPGELDLGDKGMARMRDMETGQDVILHTGTYREAYRKAVGEHVQALRTFSAQRQVDYVLARTDTSYLSLFDRLT